MQDSRILLVILLKKTTMEILKILHFIIYTIFYYIFLLLVFLLSGIKTSG